MIECSSENIWYKKRKPKNGKRFFAILFILLIGISCVLYYKYIILNNIYNICFNYANSSCTEAVNEAILLSLDESTKYTDFVKIEKDSSGNIVLMSANSYKINKTSREIVEKTTKEVQGNLSNGIPIPILAFLGIGIISGYGKDIYLKTVQTSSVTCDFVSDFKSLGINQTLHSIYTEVTVNIVLNLPLSEKNQSIKTRVLITENVIVGKVPDTYLNGNLFAR